MKQTYRDRGMDATFREDSAMIDGLQFSVFRITIYDKNKSSAILRQIMYSRLLNGYDFTITLNCKDENLMPELEAMLFSSKFSKRE
jgi:hypothetical protein